MVRSGGSPKCRSTPTARPTSHDRIVTAEEWIGDLLTNDLCVADATFTRPEMFQAVARRLGDGASIPTIEAIAARVMASPQVLPIDTSSDRQGIRSMDVGRDGRHRTTTPRQLHRTQQPGARYPGIDRRRAHRAPRSRRRSSQRRLGARVEPGSGVGDGGPGRHGKDLHAQRRPSGLRVGRPDRDRCGAFCPRRGRARSRSGHRIVHSPLPRPTLERRTKRPRSEHRAHHRRGRDGRDPRPRTTRHPNHPSRRTRRPGRGPSPTAGGNRGRRTGRRHRHRRVGRRTHREPTPAPRMGTSRTRGTAQRLRAGRSRCLPRQRASHRCRRGRKSRRCRRRPLPRRRRPGASPDPDGRHERHGQSTQLGCERSAHPNAEQSLRRARTATIRRRRSSGSASA